MTETEKILADRYGLPPDNPKKERSIADIFADIRKNAVKPTTTSPVRELSETDVAQIYISEYQKQVAFRNKKFIMTEQFENEARQITDWLNGGYLENRWLYLHGRCGNGKSTAQKAICATLAKMGMTITAKSDMDLSLLGQTMQQSTIQQVRQRAENEYVSLFAVPVFSIDDFGVGNEKFTQEVYLRRYENQSITIFSTNMDFAEIEKTYSPRLADRFYEMSEVVRFWGDSYRRIK